MDIELAGAMESIKFGIKSDTVRITNSSVRFKTLEDLECAVVLDHAFKIVEYIDGQYVGKSFETIEALISAISPRYRDALMQNIALAFETGK
ncbi:hypothetical protein HDV04_001804 [Boothiomyces sp. JEL0838]|nr:hypothetical protein HDV04_001804 [Boothiomyces sp. JEL0838]